MASTYRVLGQVNPSATTLTSLYTCPAATSTVVSTLTICNLAGSTNVRVAIRPSGAAIANQHYIVYDQYITANDTIILTLGITLSTTDVISVYAGTATVVFNAYGSEVV